MQKTEKKFFDEQGNMLIRPYRLMDLAAIYDVSSKTMRRWIDAKAPNMEKTRNVFYH
ncbi:MAG: hypothetical protein IPP99_00370 [Chitinophagaceae bacterium]|nr:hypothetical protein [Chitinophagaceae bacterium]